jgi:hypothetical protein
MIEFSEIVVNDGDGGSSDDNDDDHNHIIIKVLCSCIHTYATYPETR